MDQPQVIIVGAGPAGASAAIYLAQQEVEVVLLDRGMPVGSKNLSGGVLWGNDLAEILPNWQEEAPLERKIVSKRIGLLAEEDSMVIDLNFNDWKNKPGRGYSILRAYFDDWLANQATDHGAAVLPGITIDRLLFDGDQVVGVAQGDDEMRAPIVILAEGANPRLLMKYGLIYNEHKAGYEKTDALIGIKELIELDAEGINDRFHLEDNLGLAGEFIIGNIPGTAEVGGFFYTNKNSISLGIVAHLDSLQLEDRTYEMLEYYKNHPYIAKLIQGGQSIEYGAKLIPELGIRKLPHLYGNGYMVIGDAAGFVFSNGIVIQGMNYAIKSGILAGETALSALGENKFNRAKLSLYESKLKNSYILKDFKKFKNVKRLTKNQRLFHQYPTLLTQGFKEMLTETGEPKKHMISYFRDTMKETDVGLFRLIRDGLQVRHI